jgi:hypothetical protein
MEKCNLHCVYFILKANNSITHDFRTTKILNVVLIAGTRETKVIVFLPRNIKLEIVLKVSAAAAIAVPAPVRIVPATLHGIALGRPWVKHLQRLTRKAFIRGTSLTKPAHTRLVLAANVAYIAHFVVALLIVRDPHTVHPLGACGQ